MNLERRPLIPWPGTMRHRVAEMYDFMRPVRLVVDDIRGMQQAGALRRWWLETR